MRPWFVVAIAACSSGARDESGKAVAVPADQGRTSIDITPLDVPVVIRGVEVAARPDGDLDVTYRVEAKGPALVPARTMCRVGGRNVVYPMAATGKVPGPRLSGLYRADPFNESANVCQILFFYAPDEVTQWRLAGRACFEAGKLRDGACADTSFPPPELPSAGAIVLEQTLLELHDNSAIVTALFTLTQPVSADRRLLATLRCEDKAGATESESGLAFVPLDEIPVGASVYGPVPFPLDRTPSADTPCALQIVSRPVADGSGGDRVLAQYCLTTRTVRVGRC